MSANVFKLIDVVNNEIKPLLSKMHSERQRVEMRSTLMALERMVKSIRRELLLESKNIKETRKNNRLTRKGEEKNDIDPSAGHQSTTAQAAF